MTNADMNRPTTTPPMQMPNSSQSSPPGSSVSGTHATSTAGTVDSRRLRLLAAGCPGVYEELLREDLITGVIGALEYDPELSCHTVDHRAFLKDDARFKQVVPITDEDALEDRKSVV